jgi:hypothetical protein
LMVDSKIYKESSLFFLPSFPLTILTFL